MTTGSAGDGEAHEKRIALRVENGGSAYEASAGWPRPAERGVIPIDGPGGQALQFTTGYAIYDGIAPAGSGAIWTVAFWLRPDEPDWGIWQVPWSSTRDPKTMFRFSHPTVMHLGTFLTHLWEVHLCRNHLELQVGDWRAWSTAEIEVGRWTHVAIVRDGDTLKLYLDGKADALQPPDMLDGATGALLGKPNPPVLPPLAGATVQFHPSDGAVHTGIFPILVVGSSHDGQGYQNKFIGAIGHLTIENRARGAQEIAQEAAASRAQADRLAQRSSVLDDPLGGYSRRVDRMGETAAQFQRRIAWFHQAKYGLFMHWNPSSIAKRRSPGDAARERTRLRRRFTITCINSSTRRSSTPPCGRARRKPAA